MCGHSYHDLCARADDDSRECFECTKKDQKEIMEQKKEVHAMVEVNATKFFLDLEKSPKKFETIAEYMGKGMFHGLHESRP